MSVPLSAESTATLLKKEECFQNPSGKFALNHDDHDYDDREEDGVVGGVTQKQAKEYPSVSTSVIAYLPGCSVWDILSRVWKVVSLLLNFGLICTAFYWSYMLFKAINCEDEDFECYEDTEWVVSWTNWLYEAVMPDEEDSSQT